MEASRFPTKNLSETQARECASLAAEVFKDYHVAIQSRNGRWMWRRLTWPVSCSIMAGLTLRHQVYNTCGQPSSGLGHAKI